MANTFKVKTFDGSSAANAAMNIYTDGVNNYCGYWPDHC